MSRLAGRWVCLVAIAMRCTAGVQAAEELGMVRLRDGTVFKGTFGSQNESGTGDAERPISSFDWVCPTFKQPLTIPWERIDSVTLPAAEASPSAARVDGPPQFVFEFWDGGCLTGEIKSIAAEYVELESVRFPIQKIELKSLRSILRVQEGETRDAGVLPAAGWTQSVPTLQPEQKPAWQLQVDALRTQMAGAQVRFPVFIPEVCSIEIDTAWNHSSPNWIFTVGAPRQLQLHLRKIEHRNALAITLLFEESQNADISTAIVPFEGLESIKLRILADYIRGRFALELAGKTIAEIHGKEKKRSGGLQPILFTNNTTGGISLRDVRISRSVFSLSESDAEQQAFYGEPPTVILKNSEEYLGWPEGFDSSEASFGFAGSSSTLGRVQLSSLERIEFHAESQTAHQKHLASSRQAAYYSIELNNGGCFTASDLSWDKNGIRLTGTPLGQSIACSLADVASIRIRNSSLTPPVDPVDGAGDGAGTGMRLVTDYAISRGWLADQLEIVTQFPESQGGLYWGTKQCLRVAELSQSVDGVIDILPTNAETVTRNGQDSQTASPQIGNASGGGGIPLSSLEATGRYLLPGEPALYLTSGDALPAVISSISNGEVKGSSEYFGEFVIPSHALHGYRLLVYTGNHSMDPNVVKRLLTVPRLQRDNPPQNLVVSREGDAVRGTVDGYTPESITLKVRGKEQSIDTKNVAEIVWLPAIAPEARTGSDSMVHVVMAHGTSVRVAPSKVMENQLLGQHALLGACALPFRHCKRILMGAKIEEGLRSSHFTRWKLQNAIDPRFIQREQEAAAVGAGKSKWIGMDRPEWKLERLDAPELTSAETNDQVVVMTFWNSGSDACLEWLPLAAGALADFSSREVRFVAVNNMENAQVVRAASIGMDLQKLNPDLQLALDRDGSVARSFEILAMPYTVIIGRDGKISQVQLGNDLASIQILLDGVAAALHPVVAPSK